MFSFPGVDTLSAGISLIVGLGNPGDEYAETRHNAGEWFVRKIAETHQAIFRPSKFFGLHTSFTRKEHLCHLLIPTTFMNLSGQSVQALTRYYKIPAEKVLVAHDEIDLKVGEVKLKFDGGHGGHNGLRNIIQQLGTNKFYRLRIGVGHPGHSDLVHDYVLSPPKKSEYPLIERALHHSEEIIPELLEGNFQKAMMSLHTHK